MGIRFADVRLVLLICIASAALSAGAQSTAIGEFSARDRVVMEAAFSRADTNDDGLLSKEESARLPVFAAKFDELDADHDGTLDLLEFAVGFAAPM